jgi:hypothetical protein
MANAATYDDVNLIIKIYELRRDPKLREARDWFNTSFTARTVQEILEQCPPGSDQNAHLRMVGSYWDMVSSFINSGVLNAELFFQSGYELLACWERVKDVTPSLRELHNAPQISANLEAVAKRYAAWMEKTAPGSYERFAANARAQVDAART